MFGREIKTIFNESLPTGEHQIKFSVADLPNGIYYYAVYGDNFTGTRKFIVSNKYGGKRQTDRRHTPESTKI